MPTVNPILATTALLHPQMPGVYNRNMIYDPTWGDPSYAEYTGMRIVPAVGSVVKDVDNGPLWVISVDPVTHISTYTAMPLSTANDNVVSLLNYGNSVLRLYVDYRNAPYPATVDSKCIFIGKSPRSYSLTRYPRTPQQTIISQYFDSTGQLVSGLVPLQPLDSTNTSWYLQRGHINQILDENEEIGVTIYSEDGIEVGSAVIFAKTSAVINESVVYTPTIIGLTLEGNQRLANGSFYLHEKQNFDSLGLQVTVIYDDGNTTTVPIDGQKCVLYGQSDFIASFSGLTQYLTVKYFRSNNESLAPGLADPTGSMITTKVPVVVVPNTLGTTAKIMAMPYYNSNLARYLIRYVMYFGDGRSAVDITANTTITSGTLNTTSSHFGISQSYIVSVNMRLVDPTNYATDTTFQQTIVLTLNNPNQVVRYTIRDGEASQEIYGLDTSVSKRPSLRWDTSISQMFVPSYIFGNRQAFLNSFYYKAAPPYDPSISTIPQEPTHFVIRNIISNAMIISAPISVTNFNQAFNIINDTTGQYVGTTVIVEFINRISNNVSRVLYGVPVDVVIGNYVPT